MTESVNQQNDFAPPRILDAALFTLHRALVQVRNVALSSQMDRREISQIAEALHEVPDFLAHWSHHDLEELRMHIGYRTNPGEPGSLNLLLIFDARLGEFTEKA